MAGDLYSSRGALRDAQSAAAGLIQSWRMVQMLGSIARFNFALVGLVGF